MIRLSSVLSCLKVNVPFQFNLVFGRQVLRVEFGPKDITTGARISGPEKLKTLIHAIVDPGGQTEDPLPDPPAQP